MANRGLLQAAGSWSVDACCAVHGNDCSTWNAWDPNGELNGEACNGKGCALCIDRASSSDWLFGLGPGPPQRFEPTGTDTTYQRVGADAWPSWGDGPDLQIGNSAPALLGGSDGACDQGVTYRGTYGEICGVRRPGGGRGYWGATDVEVWYPR